MIPKTFKNKISTCSLGKNLILIFFLEDEDDDDDEDEDEDDEDEDMDLDDDEDEEIEGQNEIIEGKFTLSNYFRNQVSQINNRLLRYTICYFNISHIYSI